MDSESVVAERTNSSLDLPGPQTTTQSGWVEGTRMIAFIGAAPSTGKSLAIAFAALAIVGLLIWLLTWAAGRQSVPRIGPTLVFFTSIAYLVLLLVAIVLYSDNFYGIQTHLPPTVANALPLAVPWFGALGAVVISLQGVFDHNGDWENRFGLWHMARPIFGATLAIVGYFIFITFVQTTGAQPVTPGDQAGAGDATATITNPFIYYILAFLIGYREQTFRKLIQKATDVILGPGDTGATAPPTSDQSAGPSVDVIPSHVDHGSVTPESVSVVDVELKNTSGSSINVTDIATSNSPEWSIVGAAVAGKVFWAPGSPQAVADGSSLWVRTRWAAPAGAQPEAISRATLTVQFTGFEGSPKTAVLTGRVSAA